MKITQTGAQEYYKITTEDGKVVNVVVEIDLEEVDFYIDDMDTEYVLTGEEGQTIEDFVLDIVSKKYKR